MKMKKKHYKRLVLEISRLHSLSKKRLYTEMGFTEKRYRWDLLHLAALPQHFISDTLYPYLNDDHIDTALRHAIVEIDKIREENLARL